MFHDDLCFEGDYGSLNPMAPQPIGEQCECRDCQAQEAEMTARICQGWNELAEQRRRLEMTDERTTRLTKMLNIANRLTELHIDTTNLVLHDGSDEELSRLQDELAKAEQRASSIYSRWQEVTNG